MSKVKWDFNASITLSLKFLSNPFIMALNTKWKLGLEIISKISYMISLKEATKRDQNKSSGQSHTS